MTNLRELQKTINFIDTELNKLDNSDYGFQVVINDHKGNKTFFMQLNETLLNRIKKILL